ncbi:MAG: hypothetical protein V1918_01325 [Planctomycetota bacterium]
MIELERHYLALSKLGGILLIVLLTGGVLLLANYGYRRYRAGRKDVTVEGLKIREVIAPEDILRLCDAWQKTVKQGSDSLAVAGFGEAVQSVGPKTAPALVTLLESPTINPEYAFEGLLRLDLEYGTKCYANMLLSEDLDDTLRKAGAVYACTRPARFLAEELERRSEAEGAPPAQKLLARKTLEDLLRNMTALSLVSERERTWAARTLRELKDRAGK